MSLKPRYSLLTLLLLTAGIAVGVKLWRGPHRATVSEPLTAEETALFSDFVWSKELQEQFQPVVYKYDYINEWNRRRILFVRGHSTNARPIPVYLTQNDPERGFLLRDSQPTPLLLAAEKKLAKHEHVVCWIYPTKEQELIEELSAIGKKMTNLPGAPWVIDKGPAIRCYFLSSRKKIYLFSGRPDSQIPFKHVELSDLDDPEFREGVARELARIPEAE